jgi:hypothetical protein
MERSVFFHSGVSNAVSTGTVQTQNRQNGLGKPWIFRLDAIDSPKLEQVQFSLVFEGAKMHFVSTTEGNGLRNKRPRNVHFSGAVSAMSAL